METFTITKLITVPKSECQDFINSLEDTLFARFKGTVLEESKFRKQYKGDMYGFLVCCYNIYVINGLKGNTPGPTSMQCELDGLKHSYDSLIEKFNQLKQEDLVKHGKVIYECMNAIHQDLNDAINLFPFVAEFLRPDQVKRIKSTV